MLSVQNNKNIKNYKEKWPVKHKGKPVRIIGNLSTETLKAKGAWNDASQVLKK
jgi:hypothetical protein